MKIKYKCAFIVASIIVTTILLLKESNILMFDFIARNQLLNTIFLKPYGNELEILKFVNLLCVGYISGMLVYLITIYIPNAKLRRRANVVFNNTFYLLAEEMYNLYWYLQFLAVLNNRNNETDKWDKIFLGADLVLCIRKVNNKSNRYNYNFTIDSKRTLNHINKLVVGICRQTLFQYLDIDTQVFLTETGQVESKLLLQSIGEQTFDGIDYHKKYDSYKKSIDAFCQNLNIKLQVDFIVMDKNEQDIYLPLINFYRKQIKNFDYRKSYIMLNGDKY